MSIGFVLIRIACIPTITLLVFIEKFQMENGMLEKNQMKFK